ncbi:MAG: tetratricopeptide repeat protein [Cyclobacteriaceae bacterium]|nr:tetratricopeptide repeat protein [Cyclobacteriaceae bacterium]
MKKTQLILIIVGVLAIVGLYSLPKIVVDNEAQAGATVGQESEASSENAVEMHAAELSEEKENLLSELRNKAAESSISLEELENLANLYQEKAVYDSAAYFLSVAAGQSEELIWDEKTGNAYFEAFTFALDPQKVEATAEKAREYLGTVLENDPTRSDLKSKIAMTYVSSSNPMQGIMMLREILEEDPQNEDALFNMGILSMQSGQYKRAVERFEELVNYHPDNLQGQFYLGVSYFESNQRNKAKAQFEAVKEMTQDSMILESVQSYLDRL